MATKRWKVDVGGRTHDVELRWTYWAGSREILLDGRTVEESKSLLAWETRQEFEIDGRRAVLETRPKRKLSTTFAISLTLEGEEIEPEPDS